MMKITVIGGGSTYTPELIQGFLQRIERLPITELCLMDNDPERLETLGRFARQMVSAKDDPFRVSLTDDQRQAIDGASYIITQFRVGKMPARIADEYLGRRHGLIGQETTGIGGMAKALRTIPVLLGIANNIREINPGVLWLNFTNPSGLVTEALNRYAPDITVVGVCNSAITTRMEILKRYNQMTGNNHQPDQVKIDALGLNHLTWYRDFFIDGISYWDKIFPILLEETQRGNDPDWDLDTLKHLGMLPNSYLQYYYNTRKALQRQENWPPSRGEQVLEIENTLLGLYSDPNRNTPPPELMLRGGAYYSTLATQVIEAHHNNLGIQEIVNVPNNGAVKEWPSDWVLELPCTIDRTGIHPISTKALPADCSELIAQVKKYELLTAEASVTGDRQAAIEALTTHPLGPDTDSAAAVLDDLLQTNESFLPNFFPKDKS